MMISLLVGLILIALLIGLWHNTMYAREAAIKRAKQLCENSEVQLLDDTVSVHKIRLARKESGAVGIKREYRFDYTLDGDARYQGRIIILGRKILISRLDEKKVDLTEQKPKEGRAKVINLKDFRKP